MVNVTLPNMNGVNVPVRGRLTPLQSAAVAGRLEEAKTLIEAGADINCKSFGEMTPLHYATFFGHSEMVTLLLTNKADIEIKGKVGNTALHWAAYHGKLDVAEILIKNGADVCAKSNNGTVLHEAVRNVEMLKFILAEIRNKLDGDTDQLRLIMNAPDLEGDTPLMWAVILKNLSCIRLLLEQREIDINKPNLKGSSALCLAAETGDFYLVEVLIRHGADVFLKSNHDSVLHQSVRHDETLKFILTEMKKKSKGDRDRLRSAINAPNTEGDSPLMWAVANGNLSSVKLLLECDQLDINKQNLKGWTALHWAVIERRLEIVKFLVGKKADTKIQDENGETAYDVASRNISQDALYKVMADFLSKATNVSVVRRMLRIL